MRSRHPQHSCTSRQGFTLTEMLIVVGIIVLIVTLTIPAMNAISGNRSIDAAQNQLAAIIGRARQEAIGLQDFRGVILFQDPNTSRICAAEVYFPVESTSPTLLDLAPAHDELLLPTGISFRTVETSGGYTPMNVIMFNNRGEFVSQSWTISNIAAGTTVTSSSPAGTALGARIQPLPGSAFPTGMPQPSLQGYSAFGFVIFPDEGGYQTAYQAAVTAGTNPNQYLSDTGITFLINKYNGTLLRSE